MFHFNKSMTALIGDICQVTPELQHVDINRILISAAFQRSRSRGGVLAYVLPLRYRDGLQVEVRSRGGRSYEYAMLPTYHEGREILYIVYFMLPRFYHLEWRDKLETVIHELYHVHPEFSGDLRRLKGRSSVHGNSMKEYERKVKKLTEIYLSQTKNPEVYAFLNLKYRRLRSLWEKVVEERVSEPKPKLLRTFPTPVEPRLRERMPGDQIPLF